MSATSNMAALQRYILQNKTTQAAASVRPMVQPDAQAPAGSVPLLITTGSQIQVPAPGAAAVTILSRTVPAGQRDEIRQLALVFLGGNFFDMSGNIIWRFLVNGAPLKGLGTQIASIGTFATPAPVWFSLTENDQFVVTVEVPAAANPIPNGPTACRIGGWTVPMVTKGGGVQ